MDNMNSRKRAAILILISALCLSGCGKEVHETAFTDSIAPEDYGLEMETVPISIDGVKGSYVFLYMTDDQAIFEDREDLGWFGNTETRAFRDENGIPSGENIEHWIQYANDSKVDAFLTGGDMIDYGSAENIQTVQKKMSELTMPYLYTYGNHDSYIPWENTFADTDETFLKVFKDNNCEFQSLDMGEFYVASIRDYQVDGIAQISAEALEGFQSLYKKGKPIILICHVPIYTAGAEDLRKTLQNEYGELVVQYDAGDFGTVNKSLLLGEDCGYELTPETEEFLKLLTADDSPVVAVLAGHLHAGWSGNLTDKIYEYVGQPAFLNQGALVKVQGSE